LEKRLCGHEINRSEQAADAAQPPAAASIRVRVAEGPKNQAAGFMMAQAAASIGGAVVGFPMVGAAASAGSPGVVSIQDQAGAFLRDPVADSPMQSVGALMLVSKAQSI
jgi:hypothetical protein